MHFLGSTCLAVDSTRVRYLMDVASGSGSANESLRTLMAVHGAEAATAVLVDAPDLTRLIADPPLDLTLDTPAALARQQISRVPRERAEAADGLLGRPVRTARTTHLDRPLLPTLLRVGEEVPVAVEVAGEVDPQRAADHRGGAGHVRAASGTVEVWPVEVWPVEQTCSKVTSTR